MIDLTSGELREYAELQQRFRMTVWSSEEEWKRWQGGFHENQSRVGASESTAARPARLLTSIEWEDHSGA